MGINTIWDYIGRAFHCMFTEFYIDGNGVVSLGAFLFCIGLVHLFITWFLPFLGRRSADRVNKSKGD